jgi:hypothetical protein
VEGRAVDGGWRGWRLVVKMPLSGSLGLRPIPGAVRNTWVPCACRPISCVTITSSLPLGQTRELPLVHRRWSGDANLCDTACGAVYPAVPLCLQFSTFCLAFIVWQVGVQGTGRWQQPKSYP